LMRYSSSDLTRCRLSDLMKSCLVKFDKIARIKFDESLSSRLMSRFRRVWWVVSSSSCHLEKIELDFVRHLEKIRVEQSKHRRWNDQAWSRERIHRDISARKNLKSHFSITSHISRQDTLLASSQHVVSFERTFLIVCKRERLSRRKTAYITIMFSKKREIKTLKTIKRLFSFIIACYSKSLNTIQSFREVKRRNRLTLKDFHHIFQDVIAARQKDLELDFDYNSFLFKLSSSVISNQFFRKSIFDSLSDIDLFDLEVRSSSSLRSLNRSFNKHVSFEQLISFVNSLRIQSLRSQSFRSYERKYQNDLSLRDNAIERFFRILNMTDRDARSADFHESLTLRRSRRAFKLSNSDRRNLDRKDSQRSRRIINIRENQKVQNRQS
jgi:hypothetical protein